MFYVTGKYYTGEQLLNIQCFSLLRQWMIPTLQTVQEMNAPPVAKDDDSLSSLPSQEDVQSVKSEDFGSETSSVTVRQRDRALIDASLHYCLRLIDQCDRSELIKIHFIGLEFKQGVLYQCYMNEA